MKIQACKLSAQYKFEGDMELLITVDKRSAPEVEKAYEQLKDKLLVVEIKQYRPKRSLDANAYAWVVMDKIAEELSTDEQTVSKVDVYRDMIRNNAGAFEVLPMPDKAVNRFVETWQANGLGWQCDTVESAVDGYTNVVAYYGSSAYDTKEMSRLIDAIVAEAKGLGIETLPPAELERMKKEWKA